MATDALIRAGRPLDLDVVPERRPRRWPFSPWHFFLIPLALIMLMPLIWSVVTSLETASEAQRFPPVLIPQALHFSNYVDAWNSLPFGHFFLNSFLYSSATVAGNLLFCSLAAYAFARLRFIGNNLLFVLLLVTLMVPFQVVLIPTFLIVRHLGLVDSVGGLIVPNLCGVFGIFLLRQFFQSLPVELEEAARIDGASRLGVFFKIVLPLSAPVLATLAIIQFMWSWNDFLWPLIIITTPQNSPLQLGLSMFQGTHVTNWNLLMAGTVMSQIPMLAVFLLAQRWFIQSIAYTGIKQ